MSGERRAHRNLGRVRVAHLADHDHVGVLSKERPEPAGEREPRVGIDLGLPDRAEVVLDRILQGDDVPLHARDPVEAGVERRRLSAPGRAGHQHDAVWLPDHPLQDRERLPGEAQLGDAGERGRPVEDAQHDVLAVDRGERGDAEIEVAAEHGHADPPVLRQTPLRDVERGHDLDARDDRRVERLRLHRDLAQDAVDADPDAERRLVGLEVEVRGSLAHRLIHQRVHEADDRAVLFRTRRHLRRNLAERLLARELIQPGTRRVQPLDGFLDLRFGRDDDVDLEPRRLLHLVERDHVERIGHGDRQRGADLEERKDGVLPRDAFGQEPHDLGLEHVGREVHAGDPELLLVVVEDRGLGREIQPEEDLAQRGAGAPLLLERAREPLAREVTQLDQALSQRFPATLHGSRSLSRLRVPRDGPPRGSAGVIGWKGRDLKGGERRGRAGRAGETGARSA